MDLDASLKKHGTRLDSIESFIEHVKSLGPGAGDAAKLSGDVDEFLTSKRVFEKTLPDFEKAIADVAVVVDDVGKIKADLAPVLAWIAEQQKAAEELKAAHKPADPPEGEKTSA